MFFSWPQREGSLWVPDGVSLEQGKLLQTPGAVSLPSLGPSSNHTNISFPAVVKGDPTLNVPCKAGKKTPFS